MTGGSGGAEPGAGDPGATGPGSGDAVACTDSRATPVVAGLQAERTVLGWRRTALGCAALVAVLGRQAALRHSTADLALAAVASLALLVVLLGARLRRLGWPGGPAVRPRLLATAGGLLASAAAGLLVTVIVERSP